MEFALKFKTPKGRYKQKTILRKGAMVELNELLGDIETPSTFSNISKFLVKEKCSCCGGMKLNDKVLSITVAEKNIAQAENMSFDDCILYDQYTIKPILIFQLFSNTSNAIIKVFCMSEHHL